MPVAAFGANQAPRVTQLFLNDVNDGGAGVVLSSPSGSITQQYKGQLGGKLTLSNDIAASLSDAAIGTLYAGVYLYVLFKAGSTAANARGQVVFWATLADMQAYTVTPDVTATTASLMAGITLNVVSKGNYGFIQIAGIASCLFGTVTKTTPAIGDLVIVNSTPSNKTDVLADATALTSPTAKLIIGRAVNAAPASTTISAVLLGLSPTEGIF